MSEVAKAALIEGCETQIRFYLVRAHAALREAQDFCARAEQLREAIHRLNPHPPADAGSNRRAEP